MLLLLLVLLLVVVVGLLRASAVRLFWSVFSGIRNTLYVRCGKVERGPCLEREKWGAGAGRGQTR